MIMITQMMIITMIIMIMIKVIPTRIKEVQSAPKLFCNSKLFKSFKIERTGHITSCVRHMNKRTFASQSGTTGTHPSRRSVSVSRPMNRSGSLSAIRKPVLTTH